MISSMEKAKIITEVLPYIKEFSGKTVVVKYGGSAMGSSVLQQAVMQDLVLLKYVGMNPLVVHGGGPEITQMLHRLGIKTRFVKGMRVTDPEIMEVVEMVLVGKINKQIVAGINECGGKAIGLCGKDGNLIEAVQMRGSEDLGYVGEVVNINPCVLNPLVENGYIPVIAPVGMGQDGTTYNINADHVASEIAVAVGAEKLILLTDVPGILADSRASDTLFSQVLVSEIPDLIECGIIDGGMIPKVECCTNALKKGVSRTHIIDGRVPHSILLELLTNEGSGTMVVRG
ncbi:MAG: acetylglutamate kinase [Syntrophomonadaceae bacterium]|nr:acetylglutamate kinase [Syntrophomonadaceae bacterium]